MGEFVTRKEFEILQNNFNSLLKRIDNDRMYQRADNDASRQTDFMQETQISENDSAICDVADLSDVNSQAIDDLAEMVDELANQIAEMEA